MAEVKSSLSYRRLVLITSTVVPPLHLLLTSQSVVSKAVSIQDPSFHCELAREHRQTEVCLVITQSIVIHFDYNMILDFSQARHKGKRRLPVVVVSKQKLIKFLPTISYQRKFLFLITLEKSRYKKIMIAQNILDTHPLTTCPNIFCIYSYI